MTMGQWNRQESAAWNRLRTSISRLAGRVEFAGAVEAQKRGALHRHVVIKSPTPLSFDEVQALALEAGYGCVLDLQKITSAAGIGLYLSKYVTKGGDRDSVPWERVDVDLETGEITTSTAPTYRLRSQSMGWGCTMSEVRQVASLQAAARARYLVELAALLDSEPSRSQQGSPPIANSGAPPP